MAAASPQEQLLHMLQGTLAPDASVRHAAEQALQTAATVPGFATALMSLTLAEGAGGPPPHLRQSAAVLLRQFAKQCWEPATATGGGGGAAAGAAGGGGGGLGAGGGGGCTEEEKAAVRETLPRGLMLAESKLQSATAATIGEIARFDWPERWGSLLPALVALLEPGQPAHYARGAILCVRVLLEGYLSTDMLPHLLPTLLPQLHRVLAPATAGAQDFHFAPAVRAHAVAAFRELATTAAMTYFNQGAAAADAPGSVAAVLRGQLPQWVQLLAATVPPLPAAPPAAPGALAMAPTPPALEPPAVLALRIEVIRALSVLVEAWPTALEPLLPQLLPWAAATLAGYVAPNFVARLVRGEHGGDDGAGEGGASDMGGFDGERRGLEPMAIALFDFFRVAVSHCGGAGGKKKKGGGTVAAVLKPQLGALARTAIGLMSVTTGQLEAWADDPNQFVADEAEEALSFSARNSGADLLGELATVYGAEATAAIGGAACQQLGEASAAAGRGEAAWWRGAEAAMAALGSISGELIRLLAKIDAGGAGGAAAAAAAAAGALPSEVELVGVLQQILDAAGQGGGGAVAEGEEADGRFYLRGRALWCASRLARADSAAWAAALPALWGAADASLDASAPAPVRLGACTAVGRLAPTLPRAQLHALLPPTLQKVTRLAMVSARAAMAAAKPVAAAAAASGGADIAAAGEGADETLHLVLETIELLLKLGAAASVLRPEGAPSPGAAAAVATVAHSQTVPLLLALWLSPGCSRDPMLAEATLDAIGGALVAARVADTAAAVAATAAGAAPGASLVAALSARVMPPVGSVLTQARRQAEGAADAAALPYGLVESAIGLLRKLVSAHAPPAVGETAAAAPQPCSPAMLALAPQLAALLLVTDDHSAMQAGAECLRTFLRTQGPQLDGTALELMTRAAARMLDPAHSDDAALCVGGLCSRLLVSDGRLPAAAAAVLGAAVVRRLLTARMTALRQGLLFVLARLVLAGSASSGGGGGGGGGGGAAAAASPMFGAAGVVAFLRQDFGPEVNALPAVVSAEGGVLGAVLAMWVESQEVMVLFGRSGHSASGLALAEVAQLCRTDGALAALRVPVEVEEPEEGGGGGGGGMRLRSRGAANRKTLMVPLPQRLLLATARTWVQLEMDDGDEAYGDEDEGGWEDEDGEDGEGFSDDDDDDDGYDEEAEEEWARSVGIETGGAGGGGGGGGGGGFLLSDLLADDDEDDGGSASTFAEDVADAKELEAAQGGPVAAASLLETFVKAVVADPMLRAHLEQCAPFLNPLEGQKLQQLAS